MAERRLPRPSTAAGAPGETLMWSRRQLLGLLAATAAWALAGWRSNAGTARPLAADLAAEAGFGGPTSGGTARRVARIVAASGRARWGGRRAGSLRRTLFTDLGFNRVVDKLPPPRLLPRCWPIAGSCVGLGCLYLALAEDGRRRLGCAGPGHFRRGRSTGGRRAQRRAHARREAMRDGWYRDKYAVTVPPGRPPAAARSARCWRWFTSLGTTPRGRRPGPRRTAYARAAGTSPLPEPTQTGLTHQLRGRSPSPPAYETAQAAPHASRLDRNLSRFLSAAVQR